MTEQRYEAMEIDGRWFIFDNQNPLNARCWCKDKYDAEMTVRVFNLLVVAGIEKK